MSSVAKTVSESTMTRDRKVQELISANFSYARKMASKYIKQLPAQLVNYDELLSAALYGLCLSARDFDEEANTKFSTYAFYRMQGEMRDVVRRHQRRMRRTALIMPPTINRTSAICRNSLHSEVAEGCGYRICFSQERNELDFSYSNHGTAEDTLAALDSHRLLHAAIASLPKDQATIINCHYFHFLRYDEIAPLLNNCSKATISRLHHRSLKTLQRILKRRGYCLRELLLATQN